MKTLRNPTFIACLVSLGLNVVFNLARAVDLILGVPGHHGPSPIAVLALVTFTLVHARSRLHIRSFGALVAITIVVTFGMETFAVLTDLVGQYEYADTLGPKLGVVPAVIPVAWLMMIWPSLMVVESIAGGITVRSVRDVHGTRRAVAWSAWVALVVAFAMTAWDIGVEPVIVVTKDYVWPNGGAFFGVPIANFVGWVGVSFGVCFTFLLFELTQPPRPATPLGAPSWLGVLAYLVTTSITVIANLAVRNTAAAFITLFVMVPFVLAATTQLLRPAPSLVGGAREALRTEGKAVDKLVVRAAA